MVRKILGIHHEGLITIKYNNPLYDRLLNYRTYRLRITTRKRTGKETTKIKDHVKRLELTIKYHKFYVSYPIEVLNFLAELV